MFIIGLCVSVVAIAALTWGLVIKLSQRGCEVIRPNVVRALLF